MSKTRKTAGGKKGSSRARGAKSAGRQRQARPPRGAGSVKVSGPGQLPGGDPASGRIGAISGLQGKGMKGRGLADQGAMTGHVTMGVASGLGAGGGTGDHDPSAGDAGQVIGNGPEQDRAVRGDGAEGEDGTRLRLIEAAGEVFAEQGLKGARVRDICKRAGANIAAINYHFGGKRALYLASMRHWVQLRPEGVNGPTEDDLSLPARQRLERFVRMQVGRWLPANRPLWHRQLIARELFQPSELFDELLMKEIAPIAHRVATVVQTYLGAEAPQEFVALGVLSVIGQIMQYVNGRPVIDRLLKLQFTPELLEQIVQHVTDFSDAGLRAQAARLKGR